MTFLASGCGNIDVKERALNLEVNEKALNIEDGAIMKEGILKGGLHPKLEIQEGAFKEPILKVDKGAVEVQKGAFVGPAINVEKEAVKFVIESGAVNVHEGAITLNLVGKKQAPWIDTKDVRKALEGLRPLEGLAEIPGALRDKIINNEKVMQAVIKAILLAIDEHNTKYAEPPKDAP